jgi:hypothetical protein
VDRRRNLFGSRLPQPNPAQETQASDQMQQPPYWLDAARRHIVLGSLQEVCGHRRWTLFAAHVRTNHVHIVVAADQSPERVMNTFKAYASRALNRTALDRLDRRRWARHGSTRHLWTRTAISAAVHYVVCEQGQPMACFEMAAGARLPTR